MFGAEVPGKERTTSKQRSVSLNIVAVALRHSCILWRVRGTLRTFIPVIITQRKKVKEDLRKQILFDISKQKKSCVSRANARW